MTAAAAGRRGPGAHAVDRAYYPTSGRLQVLVNLLLYAALVSLALVFAHVPHTAVAAPTTLGIIALWRWGWGGLHFVRGLIYQHVVFPRVRTAADACPAPEQLLIVVTSYRIPAEITDRVYTSLFDEIGAYQVPATVVAAVSDPADVRVITECFERQQAACELRFLAQDGTGKRSAMRDALEQLRLLRTQVDAQVVLMDGDSVLGPGALRKACSVVAHRPDVGAVTTDNIPLVRGSVTAREWYRLRMAQRHNLMCSMSLSRRLLVLTGRFSVFRADLALAPSFTRAVGEDRVRHWRLGEIRLLTGDDKSTWFEVLKSGFAMLYVPDAVVYNVEALPGAGFFAPTTSLMRRWYGNMLRTSDRSIALGPARCGGLFVWWSLVDQRISMWTTLFGPTSALLLTCLYGPAVLAAYLAWILVSRGAACFLLASSSRRFHPMFPLLMYYTQVVGSLVKIHTSFHMHKQKWNRQGIGSGTGGPMSYVSTAYLLGALFTFIMTYGVLSTF